MRSTGLALAMCLLSGCYCSHTPAPDEDAGDARVVPQDAWIPPDASEDIERIAVIDRCELEPELEARGFAVDWYDSSPSSYLIAADANHAVWLDLQSCDSRSLFIADLNTGEQTKIEDALASDDPSLPAHDFASGVLAWEADDGLHMRLLDRDEERILGENRIDWLRVGSRAVTWVEAGRMRAYDIEEDVYVSIDEGSGRQMQSWICGDFLVWRTDETAVSSGPSTLHARHFDDGEVFDLAVPGERASFNDCDGEWIAWHQLHSVDETPDADYLVMRLSTRETFTLGADIGWALGIGVRVDDGHALWPRPVGDDTYSTTLDELPPRAEGRIEFGPDAPRVAIGDGLVVWVDDAGRIASHRIADGERSVLVTDAVDPWFLVPQSGRLFWADRLRGFNDLKVLDEIGASPRTLSDGKSSMDVLRGRLDRYDSLVFGVSSYVVHRDRLGAVRDAGIPILVLGTSSADEVSQLFDLEGTAMSSVRIGGRMDLTAAGRAHPAFAGLPDHATLPDDALIAAVRAPEGGELTMLLSARGRGAEWAVIGEVPSARLLFDLRPATETWGSATDIEIIARELRYLVR
jgi:hypothetical protein